MIIGKLQGGLGNQMFQYAALRAMCLRWQMDGYLDLSAYKTAAVNETPRSFELDVFKIQLKSLSADQLQSLANSSGVMARFRNWIGRPELEVLNELNFDSFGSHSTGGSRRLVGYWQSERYFKGYEDTIRKDYSLVVPLDESNELLMAKIRSEASISIHVRRGDYVTNTSANQFHGTCPPSYYYDAIARIAQSRPIEHIYMFSDDMGWVKEHLKFEQPMTLIDHNSGVNAYKDLALMAACQNHVIANSSFSWWGAWLNPDPNKLIVAPKKWFAGENNASNDIIPSTWIQL
jgi:Glycosyl transferase family 11